jgi:hypothetical protein
MSDQGMEGMERAEDTGDDVEAHGFDRPVDSPHAGATEEPPDVEGHAMGSPVDQPRDG